MLLLLLEIESNCSSHDPRTTDQSAAIFKLEKDKKYTETGSEEAGSTYRATLYFAHS